MQQYLSLSKLLEMRGMAQAAEKFKHEAHEEMQHAERIIGRMLALGAAPSASQLRPAKLDGSLPQLMQHAANLEADIVNFYAQAVRHCGNTQDHENRIFFEALLKEEQAHASDINAWRQHIEAGQPAN